MAEQLYFQKIWKIGIRSINYIRIALAILYTITVLGNIRSLSQFMIFIYFSGIGMMAIYAGITIFKLKNDNLPTWYNRLGVNIDGLAISGVLIAGASMPEGAASHLRNALFTIIIIYVIIYSGFLGSRGFVIAVGSMLAVAVLLAEICAFYLGGVKFLDLPAGAPSDPNVLSPIGEGFKVIFVFAASVIVSSLLALLLRLKDEAESLYNNADGLVQKIERQRHEIEQTAKSLNNSIGDFQIYIQRITDRMNEQAAALEQMNAAVEQLTAASHSSHESVQKQKTDIYDLTKDSSQMQSMMNELSSKNEQMLTHTESTQSSMEAVTGSVVNTRKILEKIEGAFRDVDEINKIMSEIADKTNLLALNASIEAARAGDAGRGFAVVANEVSRLAEFTADNAKKISVIVKDSNGLLTESRSVSRNTEDLASSQLNQVKGMGSVILSVSDLYKRNQSLNSGLVSRIQQINDHSSKVFEMIEEQLSGQGEISRAMQIFENDIHRIMEDSALLRERIQSIRVEADRLLSLSGSEDK
ncbi:MAG: hypothetical protein H3C43_08630 [Leptonema sp. (in: Bacteria)]|nr:hypothetical protein [Leptonema sp. (in: bacteria)]